MSDGMAFLTGAAFAGVAVLFMLKGGTNIGATSIPSSQALPFSQTNPYLVTPPSPNPTASFASPGSTAYTTDQQRIEADRLRMMLDQQRTETEQLKA
ncbi:MAG: hypothetical protein M3O33_08205, partial [Cyanobacteriota bacterium]|nr:hypothetical protein [Cyanobacteriota bacterium]